MQGGHDLATQPPGPLVAPAGQACRQVIDWASILVGYWTSDCRLTVSAPPWAVPIIEEFDRNTRYDFTFVVEGAQVTVLDRTDTKRRWVKGQTKLFTDPGESPGTYTTRVHSATVHIFKSRQRDYVLRHEMMHVVGINDLNRRSLATPWSARHITPWDRRVLAALPCDLYDYWLLTGLS